MCALYREKDEYREFCKTYEESKKRILGSRKWGGFEMKIEENMGKFLDVIRKKKDKDLESRVTDKLVQLLIDNGVKINGSIIEFRNNPRFDPFTMKIGYDYAASINSLDFSEHDKKFNDKISELEEIINTKLGRWDKHGISYKQLFDMQERINEIDNGMIKQLPRSPINIAKMLIDKPDKYSVSDLRQIAQHLLIYCDNAPEDEE